MFKKMNVTNTLKLRFIVLVIIAVTYSCKKEETKNIGTLIIMIFYEKT